MRAIAGTFTQLADGVRAVGRLQPILGERHVVLLTPQSSEAEIHSVPTTEDMPPVVGAIGGVLGGALGVATALIPGIGPITALGMAAAALLGAGGAALGWKVGDEFDRIGAQGLPIDELYVYEDALRRGRTVVIAFVDDEHIEEQVRDILAAAGAERLDAAEQWWLGLRDAEAAEYRPPNGGNFSSDEPAYRKGFEAALAPQFRGRRLEDVGAELAAWCPSHYDKQAFRYGFQRGQHYFERQRTMDAVRDDVARTSAGSSH